MDVVNSTLHVVDLAPELIQHILAFLHPPDLLSFGQTCTTLASFTVPSNQLLWRNAFLLVFDDPRPAWESYLSAYDSSDWDWHAETRKRFQALKAVASENTTLQTTNYEEHLAALLDMLETAPRNSVASQLPSSNLALLEGAFRGTLHGEQFIHDFHPTSGSPDKMKHFEAVLGMRPITRSITHQAPPSDNASRFHILYGMTQREKASQAAKGVARSLTYNFHSTTAQLDYGPFRPNGRVNWQLLEAVHSVILRNFELAARSRVTFPSGLASNVPLFRGLRDTSDWAGIEGVWFGTYAFLDYSALFFHNVAQMDFPHLNEIGEAHGGMGRARLRLDDSLVTDSLLQTRLPISDRLPKLYFSGLSTTEDFATITIHLRGFAALMPGEKEVRWRFIVSYDDEDQWILEGIQPGGPRTGGVFGIWTQSDHEEHGPIGPFCYFSEALCGTNEARTPTTIG